MTESIPKPKLKRGGQVFEPTAHQRIVVRALKAIGEVTNESIALAIIDPKTGKGISVPTLYKAFPEEMREGKLASLGRVINSVYRQALKGNMKAASMLMVALAPEEWGFTKHLRIIASKDGGGDLPPEGGKHLEDAPMENLTDEELEEIIRTHETAN